MFNEKLTTLHVWLLSTAAFLSGGAAFVFLFHPEYSEGPYANILALGLLFTFIIILNWLKVPRHNRLQKISFAVVILTGMPSFFELIDGNGFHVFFESLYATVKLFFLNLDTTEVPFSLEIARWFAVLFILSAVLNKIYNITTETFKSRLIGIVGNHYVICGLNEAAKELALDLRKDHKKVIVIEKDHQNEFIGVLRRNGAVVIEGDFLDYRTLEKANVINCRHLLMMTKNDTLNIEALIKTTSIFKQRKTFTTRKTRCCIHIVDPKFHKVIEEFEKEINNHSKTKNSLDLEIFNLYETTAKVLFRHHPLYKHKAKGEAVHLLIVGFGKTGQHILLQAARLSHFMDGKKLHVTIIDKEADYKIKSFRKRYKFIDRVCTMKVITKDVETITDLTELRLEETKPITYIAVSLSSDHIDFINGLFFWEQYHTIPVAIHMERDVNIAEWVDQNVKQFKTMYRFGDLQNIASEDVIINHRLDELAEEIHDYYCDTNEGGGPSWEELSLFHKNSNRAQADHIETKLNELNFHKKRRDKIDPQKDEIVDEKEYHEALEGVMEQLAKSEHARWCAFHFTNNWDTKQTIENKNDAKDNGRKLHSALVQWEELAAVEDLLENTNYRDGNRKTVKNLYSLLKAKGYVVCRGKAG
ncbi:NAD-binding protein [Bacillus sp. H-16]|uniref:NAD-binding protein n=1 Tax=Alteribacter salitolerans TaxID=2912333 RepID=UPI0019656501|nr:NAD-binding protein [Alteribacter salitolerans]MBM7095300.1 NAD-binding protein [Alteribacter salitolerans]